MATIVRASKLMVLVLAFMALVAPSVAQAHDDGTRHFHPALIGGMVFDSHGDRVGGARVVLIHRGHVVQRTLTDDEGRFHFEPVRHGIYIIRAAKDGVGHGARRIFARPGRNPVRIRLR